MSWQPPPYTPWAGMGITEWRRRTQHGKPGWQPVWTPEDEERLKERVARLARSAPVIPAVGMGGSQSARRTGKTGLRRGPRGRTK